MTTQKDVRLVAVGFREAGEGDDGGGATWENETRVELLQDRIRISETDAHYAHVRQEEVLVGDLVTVELRPTLSDGRPGRIRFKSRKQSFWDYLLPPTLKVYFRTTSAEQFAQLASTVRSEISQHR